MDNTDKIIAVLSILKMDLINRVSLKTRMETKDINSVKGFLLENKLAEEYRYNFLEAMNKAIHSPQPQDKDFCELYKSFAGDIRKYKVPSHRCFTSWYTITFKGLWFLHRYKYSHKHLFEKDV